MLFCFQLFLLSFGHEFVSGCCRSQDGDDRGVVRVGVDVGRVGLLLVVFVIVVVFDVVFLIVVVIVFVAGFVITLVAVIAGECKVLLTSLIAAPAPTVVAVCVAEIVVAAVTEGECLSLALCFVTVLDAIVVLEFIVFAV